MIFYIHPIFPPPKYTYYFVFILHKTLDIHIISPFFYILKIPKFFFYILDLFFDIYITSGFFFFINIIYFFFYICYISFYLYITDLNQDIPTIYFFFTSSIFLYPGLLYCFCFKISFMFLEISKWPHFNSFLVSWLHFFSKIPLIPWDIHATNFLFVFLCNLDIYIFQKLALVPPDIHITYFLIFSSILAWIYLLFLRYPHYLWFKKIFFVSGIYIIF